MFILLLYIWGQNDTLPNQHRTYNWSNVTELMLRSFALKLTFVNHKESFTQMSVSAGLQTSLVCAVHIFRLIWKQCKSMRCLMKWIVREVLGGPQQKLHSLMFLEVRVLLHPLCFFLVPAERDRLLRYVWIMQYTWLRWTHTQTHTSVGLGMMYMFGVRGHTKPLLQICFMRDPPRKTRGCKNNEIYQMILVLDNES